MMMTIESADRPLEQLPLTGVRVLDMTSGALGAIGRQLAELGADVVLVEPRTGGCGRRAAPLVNGVSLSFVAANVGKRGIALDLGNADDRDLFHRLAGSADVLIEMRRPGTSAALDVPMLRRAHPTLVILSVSPFGVAGAFREWQATGPVLHALSGELSRSGIPGRAPLLPPGDLAMECAAVQAAFVVLLAYLNRLQSEKGDWLDLSLLDAASQAIDPGYGIGGSATAGVPASKLPRGRPEARFQYPIIPCADGHVRICLLAPRQWRGMFEWLGRPDEFAAPSFNILQNRYRSPTLIPAIARFFAGKARADLERAGQKYGVPIAGLLTLQEAFDSDQMHARRAFVTVEVAPGIGIPVPDGCMELDGRRAGLRRPAPSIGQHNIEVLADWNGSRTVQARASREGERPLSGLRVIDMGVIVVGAELGRLLADQGADVIKLENSAYPDGSRQSRDGRSMSVTFAAGNRNKLGLGLDLRQPQGKAIFLRLVEQSDVILSNFKPGTLESLGLDYDVLSRINPRIIMADSSAFGSSGPWSRRLGYGPLVRASAGLTHLWRYPGEPDSFSDAITVYPDHVAGRVGAIGVLSLLIRRRRTMHGGTVSVSQAEVMLSHMSAQIAALSVVRHGGALDSQPLTDAPWGVYACAGDDDWCVVTVRDDADWQALCRVINRPDLGSDPQLADSVGRDAQRERIDRAVGDWLAANEPRKAAELLQHAGVPAGPMLRVSELPQFAYFRERGLFREAEHPWIQAPFLLEGGPVRSESLLDPPQRPAPLAGEHSVEIVRTRLGLKNDEVARLIESKVLEIPAPGGGQKARAT
jgi:crotonobetainyl-CoA:carnitine CoA-transferase CaiB-like acyl-CoA transferase